MLTESGYLWALMVYVVSALLALVVFNLWFLKGRSLALRVLLSFPLAALLLTPAYIEPDGETFAPALIVTAFQWLSQGPEAAEHAVRPLGLFAGAALLAGILIAGVTTWRQRRSPAE